MNPGLVKGSLAWRAFWKKSSVVSNCGLLDQVPHEDIVL